MKKIVAFLHQSDNEERGISNNFGNQNNQHLGKVFVIGQNRLTVENTIAEGGFGIVLRVQSDQARTYALKRTRVNNESDLINMKREIMIVSSLTHKNILQYVDSKITEIEPGVHEILLVTAYYPGSLSEELTKRRQMNQRFSETEVLRILCDMCEALARLHHCQTPIIHRDMKIENILIDSRRNYLLCDFGSATSRVLHPGKHGPLICQELIEKYTTLAYRAPEMVDLYTDGGRPIGLPVDIWALGCLIFGVCFFVLPFGTSTLSIQNGQFTFPDNSTYSLKLHQLINYLMTVDVFKRPDVFQVASLTFDMIGRPNPVQNISASSTPQWQDLVIVPKASTKPKEHISPLKRIEKENEIKRTAPSVDQLKAAPKVALSEGPKSTATSVIPRQRPRPAKPPPQAAAERSPEDEAKRKSHKLLSPTASLDIISPLHDLSQPTNGFQPSTTKNPDYRVMQKSLHKRGMSDATCLLQLPTQIRPSFSLKSLQPSSITTPDITSDLDSLLINVSNPTLTGIHSLSNSELKKAGDIDTDTFGIEFDALRGLE